MQSDPEAARAPAEPASPDAVDPQQVARIVARYRAGHQISSQELEPLVRTVHEALGEFREAAAKPEPAAPNRTPRRAREEGAETRLWQRIVMAAIAVALLVLFWHRLAWMG